MAQNYSPDGSTASSAPAVGAELLQQAFVNLTRHIYQLEDDARRQHHGLLLISWPLKTRLFILPSTALV